MATVEAAIQKKISEGQLIIERKPATSISDVVPRFETLEHFRNYLELPEATYRSVAQAVGLEVMMGLEKSALLVLPTGCGKTAFYLCLANMMWEDRKDNGFIVVFAPFTALITDILERARARGIGAMKLELEGNKGPEELLEQVYGSLVIISANQGYYESVQGFLRLAAVLRRLKGIIGDEAQLYFDEFRKNELERLGCIDKVDVPIYLLSGSVRPSEEGILIRMFRK